MTTQSTTVEVVERLLTKKQAIPTQFIRNLLIDYKALKGLYVAAQNKIAELEAKQAEAAEVAS